MLITAILISYSAVVALPQPSMPGLDTKMHKAKYGTRKSIPHDKLSKVANNVRQAITPPVTPDSSTVRNEYLYQQFKQLQSAPVHAALSSEALHSANPDWHIIWNPGNGTPISITSKKQDGLPRRSLTQSSAFDYALRLIDSCKSIFRLQNPLDELRLTKVHTDRFGKQHVQLAQYYRGIPLWNQEITIHFDASGTMYAVNARYAPTPDGVTVTTKIDSLTAIRHSVERLKKTGTIDSLTQSLKDLIGYAGPGAQKYIWFSNSGTAHLVWHVVIQASIADRWNFFVDASSGEILEMYNDFRGGEAMTAAAVDLQGIEQQINILFSDTAYYMIDASRPMWQPNQANELHSPYGAVWTTSYDRSSGGFSYINIISPDNIWSDAIAVSAHHHAGIVFDYFYRTFNRLSLDDQGGTILSIVHYPAYDGGGFDNAGWSTAGFMIFGDGRVQKPFAGGLDIVAHEMTHGLVQYTVNLQYQYQSGALNESFADVFAIMVDRDDWLIGEDVGRYQAFRDMQNPTAYNQPGHMRDYVYCEHDYGGVHINSGIPNRACYLITSQIGHDKAEQLYYRILDARYLNRQSQFLDLRIAAIRAAGELFGNPSMERSVVKAAFDSVGITDSNGEPPQEPLAEGSGWIAAITWDAGMNLCLLNQDQNGDSTVIHLSRTSVTTFSSSPFSIAGNGRKLVFVDSEHNLRAIDLDTREETIIDRQGIWASLALSPDETRIAATTIYADSTIYLINLSDPALSRAIHISSPYQNSHQTSALFADALDWDRGGRFLAFDCLFNTSGSDSLRHWNILFLDTQTDEIVPVFEKPGPGVNYMNPALARSGYTVLAYDYTDGVSGTVRIATTNYNQKTVSLIEDNGAYLSYPAFSAHDSNLVFTRIVNSVAELRTVPLSTSKLQALSPSVTIAPKYAYPHWFIAGGIQNTAVHGTKVTSSGTNIRSIGKGNEIAIEYSLSSNGQVTLELFNMSGRRVQILDTGLRYAGTHTISLNKQRSLPALAQGMYVCRLTVLSGKAKIRRTHTFMLSG